MKVLFISRSTLFSFPGGDTVQMKNTASELRKLGVEIDIKLTNETIDYTDYDLIHFFNIIRPADILKHIKKFRGKFLVSPIYVDYSEYDRQKRGGVFHFLGKLFSQNILEYLKTIARDWLGGEKIQSFEYYFWGHKKSLIYIIKNASCLLPNSESEMKRLANNYCEGKKYIVVPNGIDTTLFKINTENTVPREGVLCVAQIEGRKNQLNLIKAIKETPFTLALVGKQSANQNNYFKKCLALSTSKINYTGKIEQNKITTYYTAAKVHALPSWFETTGLSSLEAGFMGCNIVISDKGDTREYFGDMAFYCDPGDVKSIKNAIEKAYNSQYNEKLKKLIQNNFTWEKAAQKTFYAYKEVLGIK